MRRRAVLLVLLTCMLSGCTQEDLKLEEPEKASDYVQSYIDAIQEERYEITGDATLTEGDYVVYPNEGQICLIADSTIGQEFEGRDFIHVSKETEVNISNGYILPLEQATGMNGEIVTDGVYLVGFDILPEKNKMGSWNMVVVSDSIPELFSKASKTSYAKYSEFDAKDGMLVKIENTYVVSRPSWDVTGRTAQFWEDYVDTSAGAMTTVADQQERARIWYAFLLDMKYTAKESEASVVTLTSTTGSIEFTYNSKTYSFAKDDVYTVTNNPDSIKPIEGITKEVKTLNSFNNIPSGTRFYIIGDVWSSEDFINIYSYLDADTDTVEYVIPDDTEDTLHSDRVGVIKDGYCVFDVTSESTSYSDLTMKNSKIAEAINDAKHVDLEIALTKGSTVPSVDTNSGCYKIVTGGFVSNEEGLSVSNDDYSIIVGGDYVLLYNGGPEFVAKEDTELVGVSFSEVLAYWKNKADGKSDETVTQNEKHTKVYQLEKDKMYEIGPTMSPNIYTFSQATDVTVYPASTGRARYYKGCNTLILQQGDSIMVSDNAVLTAQVTDAIDEAEEAAIAVANGDVIKTYIVKKEAIVGRHLPTEIFEVKSDVTVTILRDGEEVGSYTLGDEFEPESGDTIEVSAQCELSAKEKSALLVNSGVYESFNKVITDLPVGEYKLIGGTLKITDKDAKETEYALDDIVTISEGDVTSTDWFILQKQEEID